MTVGFDFGTTNSLISVVVGDRVIDVLDDTHRPHPSVVRYEGEEVIVGREARDALGDAGIGVHGNTVKSPKSLLGQQVVTVGGVDRSPIDIVGDIIKHVRTESLRNRRLEDLGDLDSAVVTIPVTMNGPRRAALREAFSGAGISIAQYVHEPLAALYGFIRDAADSADMVRRLVRRNVLVVDWGGGTLDLTLCRVDEGQIRQLRNGGTDRVGGDVFDRVIRREVVKRFALKMGLDPTERVAPEADLRLLQDAERNKIALSGDRASVTFYRPNYYESGVTLEYPLSRQELEEITRPLVTDGIQAIESLLDSLSLSPSQVTLCVVVGGMAAMPAIRSRLHEMFGPDRVQVPRNSATLVSQGAAWMAHDAQRLRLAKPIELELARGSRISLLQAGAEMPGAGEVKSDRIHLYCADPSDGIAKFPISTPRAVTAHLQASDPRTSLGVVTLQVDDKAPPLVERLELDVAIDDDLILSVTASSVQQKDTATASFFDLEFGIGLPVSAESSANIDADEDRGRHPAAGLVIRANAAETRNQAVVPGDVLYRHDPRAFARHAVKAATQEQLIEHLYYQPCAGCKRPWGHPECHCATAS